MSTFFRKVRRGFTLIELLVVIAIIAILAALLTPAISQALLRGKITNTMNNGRNIFLLLFSKELDNPLGLQGGATATWPTTADGYMDSSDYFDLMVSTGVIDVAYGFFAAPGITPAVSQAEFTDGTLRNAWAIALDVSDSLKPETPVLFTQNISSDPDLNGFVGMTAGIEPFGEKGAAVVTRGGSTFALNPDTAIATNFNPTGAANTTLYPKGGQH